MVRSPSLTRRDFLKLSGLGAFAAALPPDWEEEIRLPESWPNLDISHLPPQIQKIIQRSPKLMIRPDGLLVSKEKYERSTLAPLHPTQWNIENSRVGDRLIPGILNGIVLHWYGDHDDFDRSINGYLRGFNSLRKIGEHETRTSAHFLVGDSYPHWGGNQRDENISILQTQLPLPDGSPLVASHISGLSLDAHLEKKQYFVRALYELGRDNPQMWSLLQEMYDGKRIDPNMRTIAVEITGKDFENPENSPSIQKTANLVALVAAIMKRYNIRSLDLIGHNEIFLGKPDPGKKYMALIRFLIGVKALVDRDQDLAHLVFSPFLDARGQRSAVHRYFSFVRSYLRLVSMPKQVHTWEGITGFWNLMRYFNEGDIQTHIYEYRWPVAAAIEVNRAAYLVPENHEGVDLSSTTSGSLASESKKVYLTAAGKCLFKGKSYGCQSGQATIFRHIMPDGAAVLSIYSHLNELNDFKVGEYLVEGEHLGRMERLPWRKEGFLHYAIAYGASWETDLRHRPHIPINAGPAWIRQRFLPPLEFHRKQEISSDVSDQNLPI